MNEKEVLDRALETARLSTKVMEVAIRRLIELDDHEGLARVYAVGSERWPSWMPTLEDLRNGGQAA